MEQQVFFLAAGLGVLSLHGQAGTLDPLEGLRLARGAQVTSLRRRIGSRDVVEAMLHRFFDHSLRSICTAILDDLRHLSSGASEGGRNLQWHF
jgi:hypothetical protein